MSQGKSKDKKGITHNGYVRLSADGSRVRSSADLSILETRGANFSPNSTIRFAGSGSYSVSDFLSGLDDLRECSSSGLKDNQRPPTTDPTSHPEKNNSSTRPTLKSQKAIVGMDADYCEALVDELMSLVDFGQAIDEPTVQIAGERCLWLINEGVSGNER